MLTPGVVSGMGMLNPDGKSYAFDSRGDGYGRGEGVATVVLKRLDRALEDGYATMLPGVSLLLTR